MNLMTEASSTDGLVTAEVLAVFPKRQGGRAVLPSGEQVFLCQGAAKSVGFGVGDTVQVVLTTNVIEPENTPWYAAAVRRGDEFFVSQAHAEFFVSQGGVVQAVDLAVEVFGDRQEVVHEPGACAAAGRALQAAYRAGKCAVFVLFRSPDETGLRKCWYTANPDLADVDEWSEDDE